METLAADIRKAIVRIKVVGVGGGGNSVLLRLAEDRIPGIELIGINTDAKQLTLLKEAGIETIQVGAELTKGRGTGGNVAIGEQAAKNDLNRLEMSLRDADLVFITAGMGGGFGTGAAPVIAQLVRKMGILSVGVVTAPFSFEGKRKIRIAEDGIGELKLQMDAMIVIHNDNLLNLPGNKKMTLIDSFKAADAILRQAILCISEVILTTGVMNVDFADVVSIFRQSPSSDALLGIGESTNGRVVEAVQRAIESPLVERDFTGARGLVLNITGDKTLTLYDVNEAMEYLADNTHPDVNIIFGVIEEPSLAGTVRATLVVTDFEDGVNLYHTPKVRSEQPATAKRRPQAPPVRRPAPSVPKPDSSPSVQQPAQPAPTETEPREKADIQIPDFLRNRRYEIPPLTMHDKDGTTIPPFRPKQ